ncbi:MAG: UDP-N-acetylglucosamine--N-acetylmuramyl-(pentapeptide) pyrophosphoryl-undecaprenol N-acetylglucosamine transferase [Treponema sp.]|nr:UDP-N-acetylglucosamine--N-acetylmuramyl-(pentapeptide) pyrophosphoryl-undecaprenol N-acetylglucosamine transferase [Treponema sp.]
MKLNKNVIAFTGGGTAGHIYPGLAVADELKALAHKENKQITINWIGCSKGMDRQIVEKAIGSDGTRTADNFYGIPSGKLRRYISWQNFTDLFRIIAGYFSARRILKKLKPAFLFSKGGFVSVPPVLAAKHLGIPVYTHECDFTLGLANRLNFKSAKIMFVSYEETKARLPEAEKSRVVVTGNPVRPVIYKADAVAGRKFLGLEAAPSKPVLLVLGGSSGAKQINTLVYENLEWLCSNFIVVHQTGLLNADDKTEQELKQKYAGSYLPYQFIYEQMPDVIASADVILSRAGANSIWEAAVMYKPMVLVPLCGSGTRGDQVDNAKFFLEKNAAAVLVGDEATSENLCNELNKMLDEKTRNEYALNIKNMVGEERPAQKIAQLLYQEL